MRPPVTPVDVLEDDSCLRHEDVGRVGAREPLVDGIADSKVATAASFDEAAIQRILGTLGDGAPPNQEP